MPLDHYVTLGHSGLRVSPMCLGAMTFGEDLGWGSSVEESRLIIDRFIERGGNFIDTANFYTKSHSEKIIGDHVGRHPSRRDRLVLATKFSGNLYPGDPNGGGSGRKSIIAACENSLRRLQTDYIDLYQSHHDDESVPQAETMGIYAELIAAGKVRTIGASNFTAERLQSALEVSRRENLPRYQTLQPEYNLYDRAGYERTLEAVCVTHGLGVIPYFSLASGFLSGKYHSAEEAASRPRAGMLKKYFNERGMRVLESLEEVARELKAKPAQVALAWLMARPSITAPIASATTVEQLHELVGATRLDLPSAAVEKLNQASAETVAV